MGINVVDKTTPTQGQSVDANGAAVVRLYDAYGKPIFFPQAGSYDVAALADREIFGAAIAHPRVQALSADWTQAFASNAVNTLTSNGGSTVQANGLAQLITGTNVSGQSTVQSKQSVNYIPGRELYAQFTAAFTTPTSAASDQRAGYYSGTAYAGVGDGWYIGYHGLAFGITQRVGGAETFTAQASFNVDTLTGVAGSQFTKSGAPVALTQTDLNIYRIRWGWLGSAVVNWQIMAPDGNWVTFHRYLVPNSQATPSTNNPSLPLTFEALKNAADATSLIVSSSAWDAGVVAASAVPNKFANALDGSIVGTPIMGLDGDTIMRALRCSEFGTLHTSKDVLLWHDALEGSTVNAFWTQSTTTMTIAQAAGVLTLNNSGITTASTDAIITSQRQFPKYPRNPLHCRFRVNVTANVAANHSLVELGFGAPTGTTAVIPNGAFFRWTAAGTLVAVTSYNGTETVSSVLISQGQLGYSTASYYDYDVFLDDDEVRFLVTDSADVPIVDVTLDIPLTQPTMLAQSHTTSFARVYTDATGGGTAVQLKIAEHSVQTLDGEMNWPWEDQSALSLRQANINPTSYVQTSQLAAGAAPATETPSNTVGGYNNLGGEYAIALTAASENLLSVFAFTIPVPYSFMLTGIGFSIPHVTTAINVTGIPILEWAIIANCASGNISTGGGQRLMLPVSMIYSSATQAAGSFLSMAGASAVGSSAPVLWNPKVPIPCLPGTVLHIAYKVFVTTAAGTPGVTRGNVVVDGYFN